MAAFTSKFVTVSQATSEPESLRLPGLGQPPEQCQLDSESLASPSHQWSGRLGDDGRGITRFPMMTIESESA
jgi:hypothetical protein